MKIDFPIPFSKMSGSGNDFIIIDHRQPFLEPAAVPDFARTLCTRKFGVGADGLILIESSAEADFRWQFYNADGSLAEMCGNGARCAARYAFLKKIAPARLRFQTMAGMIEAEMVGERVKIRLTPPAAIRLELAVQLEGQERLLHSINTGVPHAVLFTEELEKVDVPRWGRIIRQHPLFQPAGTNANFAQVLGPDRLRVRTYERGVEDETMACGTGAVAAAVLAALLERVTPPVTVTTSGGEELVIHFAKPAGPAAVEEVFLEGAARLIYEGRLTAEALQDRFALS